MHVCEREREGEREKERGRRSNSLRRQRSTTSNCKLASIVNTFEKEYFVGLTRVRTNLTWLLVSFSGSQLLHTI